jgi:hypothetical protein
MTNVELSRGPEPYEPPKIEAREPIVGALFIALSVGPG